MKVKLRFIVEQCLYNDLRSGDEQWTLVLAPVGGQGSFWVYSADQIAPGTILTLEGAS